MQPPSRPMSMIRCAGEAMRLARNRSRADPVRLVEHGQVVVGVAGQPDHLGDGQDGAPTGDPDPGAALQVLQRGADDDRHRQPVELAEFSAHQGDAPDRDQRVVLALGQAAVIVVDLGLDGVPEVQGSGSAGLHMPGAAYLAKSTSNPARASGVSSPLRALLPPRLLRADGDPALAGAFGVVGCGAVLVEQEQGQLGEVAEFLGSDADRGAHQVGLELLPGACVDEAGQFGDGLADHLDVLGGDLPAGRRGRGRGEHGFQGFPEK